MKAEKLYAQLERDFVKPGLSDEWFGMEDYGDFLSENFKDRAIGVVCDNAEKVEKVYSAVFPEDEIMQKILDNGEKNAMLFLHHPLNWDIRKAPAVFSAPKKKYLEEFKKRNISIYVLHVPLDNYGEYSTSNTLADAVGIKSKKAFAKYFGSLAGVVGHSKFGSLDELKKSFEKAVGHEVSLYKYGKDILDGKIAFVGGGGNDLSILEEAVAEGASVLVTGITAKNAHSKEAHDYAKSKGISILGGTHYSTEKFACKKMCGYFEGLGLKSEFVSGKPVMEDM
ncbi:MAG: Nif3-like dinuclear metal center hexameric protein [archaeon]